MTSFSLDLPQTTNHNKEELSSISLPVHSYHIFLIN